MQGALSAKKTEYSPLKGRQIIIAIDHDEAGLKYGNDVYKQCQFAGTGSIQFLNNSIFSHYAVQAGTVIKRDQPVILKKGYDLADALMGGWTSTLLLEFEHNAEMPLFIDYAHVLSKTIHDGGCIDVEVETDDNADTTSFKHLATLSAIQYDRIRKVEAKRLGISLLTLDKEVNKYRPQHAHTHTTNEEPSDADIFPIIEPWTDPVEAEALLQELSATFKQFAILPEHADTVLALWVIFTWTIDSVGVSPILAISSPEKRCGKTTVISILGNLVCKPLLASNISAAALFRTIELWKPTIIIDEADTFIRDSDELRGIINSGHTRPTAYVIRTTGEDHIPKRFSTWGAKAIAIIGSLPDTLHDRSIVIQLRRKLIHEKTEKLRHADLSIFEDLQRKLLRFSNDQAEIIAHSRTSFPENIRISDRALDNWEPLLAIAKLAGPAWTEKVYQAASNLTEDDKETLPIGAELLKDMEILFEYKSLIKIHTTDLINYLCEDEESPWASYNFRGVDKRITPRQLSRLLTPYQIHTKNIEIGGIQRKGFEKTQLEEIWKRYNTNIFSEAS
jgi:putative DNA primase/helicase